jgi:hypothetical protein
MSLAKRRTSFGVASMVAVNRTTGIPYGIIKVVQSADPSLDREQIDLYGGANPNIVETENGNVTAELNLTISEFKEFLYTLAGFDVTSTEGTADADGAVSAGTDLKGTSMADGIVVALSTTSAASLKRGRYIFEAASASSVDVYALNDNDFNVGTDLAYVNDSLKITTAAVALSASAVEVPATGLTVKDGTGTPVLGNTCFVDVVTDNNGTMSYSYGSNPTPVEFEMFITSQKKSNGEYFIDHYPRVTFNSVPGGMSTKEWGSLSLSLKLLMDDDYGYSYRRLDKVAPVS